MFGQLNQRAAELRTGLPWARVADRLAALKAVRYRTEARTIVQRTRIGPELGEILNKLGVSRPKRLLALSEPGPGSPPPRHTPAIRRPATS